MDIQDILDNKIKQLAAGTHDVGLRAVRSHIEAAVRHFVRGQAEPDETLFTDVIFRCNQAFEGSIKEAYRVIAGKNPDHVKPFDIEQFLSGSALLRKKVLDQFTRYRQEWRNPSAHDYTLDFDENEALLAIVSVTVFAIVLCDQIESKIAFDTTAAATSSDPLPSAQNDTTLMLLVTERILSFARTHVDPGQTNSPAHDYFRLEGTLAGFLSADLSNIAKVEQNKRFASSEADIVVSRGTERLIVELKRMSGRASARLTAQRALTQAAFYLHEPDITGAIVFVYSAATRDYSAGPAPGTLSDVITIIAPKSDGRASSTDT
ncbi:MULTISPECIES: hypothetical protein [unclassified Bradyrhizobium]|uniref:hypothetical protein n=1 Tax=unclassified Bradyrhizobium TaxID=2631580 RepID=UPI00291634A5|nr:MULTISPECIES: hypothetical protein [unclassified Bradyrhizobium]